MSATKTNISMTVTLCLIALILASLLPLQRSQKLTPLCS